MYIAQPIFVKISTYFFTGEKIAPIWGSSWIFINTEQSRPMVKIRPIWSPWLDAGPWNVCLIFAALSDQFFIEFNHMGHLLIC
jgi:hypothetical protein